MVSDRQSHIDRFIRAGKSRSQKGEGTHRSHTGRTSMIFSHGLNGFNGWGAGTCSKAAPHPLNPFNPWLTILCLLVAVPYSFGQAIYSQNQIAARGVTVDYTATITNPTSHLFDIEIQ